MNPKNSTFIVLLIALVAVSLTPTQASAASWGHGTFKGKIRGEFGPRPASKVVVVAKGSKVRVKKAQLRFRCGDDKYGYNLPDRWSATVHSPSVHVRRGAAGGGAILKFKVFEKYKGQRVPIHIEVFLGLRDKVIMGTIDADISTDLPICFDSGIFNAHK
jgi:hypothetical protein